jgi:hypothetical protein
MDPAEWLLTKSERGNAQTVLDARHFGEQAWSSGNFVRPLVHGATYFSELAQRIQETRAGDAIYFTDWRGDPDERLTDDAESAIEDLLSEADIRGVDVRGLVWRSHWDRLSFSGAENRQMIEALQANDAEAVLDMRVRTGGSHHQKLVVIRFQSRPERDIAWAGSTSATLAAMTPGTLVIRSRSPWPRCTGRHPRGMMCRPRSPVPGYMTWRRCSENAGRIQPRSAATRCADCAIGWPARTPARTRYPRRPTNLESAADALVSCAAFRGPRSMSFRSIRSAKTWRRSHSVLRQLEVGWDGCET